MAKDGSLNRAYPVNADTHYMWGAPTCLNIARHRSVSLCNWRFAQRADSDPVQRDTTSGRCLC
jgi:hypothetical protein